jgi:hypothetical protein
VLIAWPGSGAEALPSPSGQLDSRAEEIESERRQKASQLTPPSADNVEAAFQRVERSNFLEGLFGKSSGFGRCRRAGHGSGFDSAGRTRALT